MIDIVRPDIIRCSRNHGANLSYTNTLHAKHFADHRRYRYDHFASGPDDCPLILQVDRAAGALILCHDNSCTISPALHPTDADARFRSGWSVFKSNKNRLYQFRPRPHLPCSRSFTGSLYVPYNPRLL